MSRKGDCYDNAVAESFFSTLEHELGTEIERQPSAVVERAVREYIYRFYNPIRRHSTLGGLSPIEFERRFSKTGGREGGGFAPAGKSFSGNEQLQESPVATA